MHAAQLNHTINVIHIDQPVNALRSNLTNFNMITGTGRSIASLFYEKCWITWDMVISCHHGDFLSYASRYVLCTAEEKMNEDLRYKYNQTMKRLQIYQLSLLYLYNVYSTCVVT